MANPIRILVIEDDSADRHLFRVTLERGLDQVTIIEADNWISFIEAIDNHSFDIILIDYQLRAFTGLDVIDEIRHRNIQTPLVMISGTGTEDIAIEAMRRGVHDYLLKSFKQIKRLPSIIMNLVQDPPIEKPTTIGEKESQQFIGAFEHAPYGVVLIDDRGIIVRVNPAIRKILGYAAASLHGKKMQLITHADDLTKALNIRHSLFSGEFDHYEHQSRLVHRKGHVVWTEETSSIICDSQQQRCYMVLQIKDITKRKRAQAERDELSNQLTRMQRLTTMGELASGLAHELNQPLTAIIHYCDAARLSLHSNSINEATNFIDSICKQSQRAGAIIKSLKQFVVKRQPNRPLVDLNALIEKTIEFLDHEIRANNVSIDLELLENKTLLELDKIQIQQVIINLVCNSIQAIASVESTQRLIAIKVSVEKVAGYITITVSDSGPGLEAKVIEHLFEPYITGKSDHIGIGLMISLSIINAHNGNLWVDRERKLPGATFHFTLPYRRTNLTTIS